tara:strand:- start:874 stop:1038 length:165 start_codon:yes stop_codon:yes gene_type:complete
MTWHVLSLCWWGYVTIMCGSTLWENNFEGFFGIFFTWIILLYTPFIFYDGDKKI